MRITILSIFPEYFQSPLTCGLMAKALDNGVIEVDLVNPRDFASDKHRSVDDRPYGGGPGMVMAAAPLMQALESLEDPGRVLLLSPRGRRFDQTMAAELAGQERLTLVCGRYEGIDARFETLSRAEPVSIGDFVLNGGESGALSILEAVSRLQPQFMGCGESAREESFSDGLLEYPQFTRPECYRDVPVPDVLLSGNHAKVAEWRRRQALSETLRRRPDLLDQADVDGADLAWLRGLDRGRRGRHLHVALLHWPVLNKKGQITSVSLTNLDIHDIARVCCTYGLGGYYLATPIEDQRQLASRLTHHWTRGPGGRANPDRARALQSLRLVNDLNEAVADIEAQTGQRPQVVATSAQDRGRMRPSEIAERLETRPVLLVFGTGSGLDESVLQSAEGVLRPLRWLDEYNHLSVRSAVGITVDRILGDAW